MVAALVRSIFAQPTAEEVWAQHGRIVEQLEGCFCEAAALLVEVAEDVLAFAAFPAEHWQQVWSNNPLERLHREIRRRTDVVGIFPNRPAMTAPTMLPHWGSSGRWSWSADGFGRGTERASARSQ